jgi:hypothetical protein
MSASAGSLRHDRPSVFPTARPGTANPAATLQRQCSCGQHTVAGGECKECNTKKRGVLRRSPRNGETPEPVPSIVGDVLASGGRPLEPATRALMERTLTGDFSRVPASAGTMRSPVIGPTDDHFEREAHRQANRFRGLAAPATEPRTDRAHYGLGGVRIHTGAQAATAAESVDAHAFTLGDHIVFGNGQYAPETTAGRQLLAHELTHVIQQGGAAPTGYIQRASTGTEVLRGLRDVAFFIPSLLGFELSYSDEELLEYLQGISDKDQPDGGYYSDDKARQVTQRWADGNKKFHLDAKKVKLLIREMQGGIVTNGDRQAIMTLLEQSSDETVSDVLSPANIDFAQLLGDLSSGAYSGRAVRWFLAHRAVQRDLLLDSFARWFAAENFAKAQQPLAERLLHDIFAVTSGLDFSNETEFKNEVVKRVSISSQMTESQGADSAFDYPENLTADSGCADYKPPVPPDKFNLANARVNKAARDYWMDVTIDRALIYYFDLTPAGQRNPYKALTKLFTPQDSICDKTLIHCDYLVNVIQFRTYAETLGIDKFNSYVKSGRIHMRLTWSGFPYAHRYDPSSPKALGYRQDMRPNSTDDLLIGDHVIFWNHLAFDGLNMRQQSPWRLENAVLTDKDSSGQDLFQGHGSGAPRTEKQMLKDLAKVYNGYARQALQITHDIKHGHPERETERLKEYPWVVWENDDWFVVDPGTDPVRARRRYKLQLADESSPETDLLLPGLLDPYDRSILGKVDRPVESAPGKAPQP